MLMTGLAIATLACGVMAVRARRLLSSAVWLAACSAFLAVLLYRLGAYEVSVIELSVGAGLVTVLFVFAINIAGDESIGLPSVIPRGLTWLLCLAPLAVRAEVMASAESCAGSNFTTSCCRAALAATSATPGSAATTCRALMT